MISRFKTVFGLVLVLGCGVVLGACGGEEVSGEEQVALMREALLELPYRVVLRDVETPPDSRGAVAGKATDPKTGVTVKFAFILGAPKKKWLKKFVGGSLADSSYNWELDMQKATNGPVGKTWAEKEQIGEMASDIEAAVCLALTGKYCPI